MQKSFSCLLDYHKFIANDRILNMKKLISVKRNNITEREHWGEIICHSESNARRISTNDSRLFYLRSCAKPLQASVLEDLGVFDYFDFTPEEIAITCASHSATPKHVAIIEGILAKIGKSVEDLQCGIHSPLDSATRFELKKNGAEPCALHNNCSGKHVGFLAACVKQGWDCATYLETEHSLQKLILAKIGDYCEFNPDFIAKDGCGAPIFAMPLENMCRGFAKVFQNHPRIADAMAQNPYVMGGEGRIDSEIIAASGGRLIAKVGAEGICMVYNRAAQEVLLVKILDSNESARAIVLIEAMLQLKWCTLDEIENTPLKKFFDKTVKTATGEVVGEVVCEFIF